MFGAIAAWVIWKFAAAGQFEAAKWQPFLTGNLDHLRVARIEAQLTAARCPSWPRWCSLPTRGGPDVTGEGGQLDLCGAGGVLPRVPVLIMMLFSYALFAMYGVFPSEYLAWPGVITV